MRLLIAEDDPLLADTLARGFREHAYAVDVATDGAQALSLARINDYDAVVLDIMMPRRDGLSVCAALRGAGQHVPILMLTARDALSERLDHAFEQQRRFMADASHELRTPVALVRAEADVALSRETRTETEYRDALEVVRGGARRLSAIVEDIFLLARADAGRVPIERKTVYLDEIVTDAARAVRSLAAQHAIRIEVRPLMDAPAIGDRELLGRLLLNLLDNAIKYSPPGSSVVVTLARTPEAHTVGVRDAGPGIPTESRAHIFERFYRADVARSRAQQSATSGAGLGLAIARWIAEEHGGQLELVSSDASGSEFLLTLPLVEE